jgi:SEC-C motif-containing protein
VLRHEAVAAATRPAAIIVIESNGIIGSIGIMPKRNTANRAEERSTADHCPCGSQKTYAQCCEPLHRGAPAASAEALMRSRYCAYALALHEYLQRSWHSSTRPAHIDSADSDPTQWLGLRIKRHQPVDDAHATVEFVARYKIAGRAFRLHEVSRFVREHGHWFYLDGDSSP